MNRKINLQHLNGQNDCADHIVVDFKKDKPKVILCVAASDPHVVANHLIAMLLRDNGFEVVNLGACTSVEEIMQSYQENPDTSAILIGSLNGHAVEDLRGLEIAKRDYQVRCDVYLGGNLSVGAGSPDAAIKRLMSDGVDAVFQDPNDLLAHLTTPITADYVQVA